jgi:hypothetical protein
MTTRVKIEYVQGSDPVEIELFNPHASGDAPQRVVTLGKPGDTFEDYVYDTHALFVREAHVPNP